MRNDLVSFENNHVQTKEAFWESEDDIVASITIDGYPEDENEPGEVVAVVYITTHGDYVVHVDKEHGESGEQVIYIEVENPYDDEE